VATAGRIDFAAIARDAGIKSSVTAATVDELKAAVSHVLRQDGPHFIWARIEAGRAEAPPLKYDELENKYRFVRYIEDTEGINILRVAMPASYLQK
jgi:thiamine pyrophosphate-dependent acetolactate synthase large subunit-like protein